MTTSCYLMLTLWSCSSGLLKPCCTSKEEQDKQLLSVPALFTSCTYTTSLWFFCLPLEETSWGPQGLVLPQKQENISLQALPTLQPEPPDALPGWAQPLLQEGGLSSSVDVLSSVSPWYTTGKSNLKYCRSSIRMKKHFLLYSSKSHTSYYRLLDRLLWSSVDLRCLSTYQGDTLKKPSEITQYQLQRSCKVLTRSALIVILTY